MDAVQVEQTLKEFILREIIRDESHPLDSATPLMDSGIIESLSLVALLGFIQSNFGVHVPDADILPRNFKNLTALTQLVLRLSGEAAA